MSARTAALTASSVFVQSWTCRGAAHEVLRSHMPFPGLCLTSRKWQAKHNCTLCKQCMPKLYSILPTFYLQYQFCSPRISRERECGDKLNIVFLEPLEQMVYVITLFVCDFFQQLKVMTHTHTQLLSDIAIYSMQSPISGRPSFLKDKCVCVYQTTLTLFLRVVFSELCTTCNISACIKYIFANTCIITL